jgi:hypothetical protein
LAGSFDQLRVLVKTGDKVRVTDTGGQDVRGSIADVSSSSLALTVGGSRRTFLEADIAAIHQRRNDCSPTAHGGDSSSEAAWDCWPASRSLPSMRGQ